MQSDDGKMIKFIISFEALLKLVSEELLMHECLRAPDAQTIIFVVHVSAWRSNLAGCLRALAAQTIIFVVSVSAWRSNLFESPKALGAQHTIFVERNAPRRLHEQLKP